MTRRLINVGTTVPLPHFLVAASLKKCNAHERNCFGRQIQPWRCRQCKAKYSASSFVRSWATLNVFGYTVSYIVLALNCWHVFESTWPKSLFLMGGEGGRQKKLKHIIRSRTINPRLFRCLIAGSEGCRWELLVYTCGNSVGLPVCCCTVSVCRSSACLILGDCCRGTLWTLWDEGKAEICQLWRGWECQESKSYALM